MRTCAKLKSFLSMSFRSADLSVAPGESLPTSVAEPGARKSAVSEVGPQAGVSTDLSFSRRDLVVEVVGIEAVKSSVGRFSLWIHEKIERRASGLG